MKSVLLFCCKCSLPPQPYFIHAQCHLLGNNSYPLVDLHLRFSDYIVHESHGVISGLVRHKYAK